MSETPIYRTAGELKAALVDVPDDTPLAQRDQMGFWINGIQAGWLTIVTIGRGKDKVAVSVDDPMWLNRKRSDPIRVVAFE